MARPVDRLFLERESYRRRRLGDAARLLPVLGSILLMLPGFLTVTVDALLYIFSVWAVLIVVIGFLSGRLVETGADEEIGDTDDPAGS